MSRTRLLDRPVEFDRHAPVEFICEGCKERVTRPARAPWKPVQRFCSIDPVLPCYRPSEAVSGHITAYLTVIPTAIDNLPVYLARKCLKPATPLGISVSTVVRCGKEPRP